jgi:hypothetical protein
MKFYFDESGSFAVKNPGPHTLIGIHYPDVFNKKLVDFYNDFVASLSPSEFIKSEPKGTELSLPSREKLFTYLNDNSWLNIAVSLTDSEFNSVAQVQHYRKEQIQLYDSQINDPIFQSKKTELKSLMDDMQLNKGLSDVQVIKGLLLMHNLFALFINSFNSCSPEVFDEDWKTFELNFDRQDKTIITRMELWINRDFINLITVYNGKNPIKIPVDWFTREHPLLKLYCTENENSLLLDKMFINGFNFLSSKDSFQLQIADWISNTLFKVFKRELSIDFLNAISSNIVKHNTAKIHLVTFTTSNKNAIFNKYKDFL